MNYFKASGRWNVQLSTLAIAIVVFASVAIDFNLKNWKKRDRVIEHDVHWYYGYLPATFIYHDITLSKSDYKQGDNYYLFWTVETSEGKRIIKSTMGLSILYAPFFFVAHGFAMLTDYPEDGFSEPYKFFLLLSAIFYLFVGLEFLRKILRHFSFSDKHIAITILLIGLGTNLLCYASQSAPNPHVYNFCLFAVFIFYTIKWYESASIKHTLILGLLLGLITLIRPSNIVILLFFALYGISKLAEFKERILFFLKKWYLFIFIFLLTFLIWIPQFLYWKKVTGHYLCYSYTDERFFFNDPKILQGMFSFRKGWLLYTPMMGFSLIGIFLLKDAAKKLRWAIVLFFIANIYIIFSWWCWWYGGTFGQRPMIDSYAMLAIPFASFIQFVSGRKWIVKGAFIVIVSFFIWLNIFQTFQFEYHSLHWDSMTKELYFKQFGKMSTIEDFDKYLKPPDSESAKGGKRADFTPPSVAAGKVQNTYTNKNEESRKLIHLKAWNNKYVCADQLLKDMVVANRNDAYDWETFILILFGNGECAICSSDNYFFCCELNHENRITASRNSVGSWETFRMTELGNGLVAFKATNDKYLSVDEKSSQLFAKSESIGAHEKFMLIVK